MSAPPAVPRAEATTSELVERIGIAALEKRLGVERSTIFRWYRAGTFPEPHYLCDRRVWFLADVEQWEREQMARPPDVRRGAKNIQASPAPPQESTS